MKHVVPVFIPVCVFTSHPEVLRSKRAMHAICTHKAVHSVLVQLVGPAHVRLERAAVPDGGERVARGCRQARKGVAVCNKAQAAAPTASSTVAAKGARERGAVRPGRGRDRRGPTVATKRPYVVRTGDVTSVRSPAGAW